MLLPQLTVGIINQTFITSVLANYTSCVIHVIDIHFSFIPVASQYPPLILSSIGDDGVDENKFSFTRKFTRQRLQSLNCFLGALMVNGFVLDRKSNGAINRLLSHGYSVGLPIASDAVIYPETFIIFDERMNDGTHRTDSPIDTAETLKIIRPEHLPSVFVLPSLLNEFKNGVPTGWTVCMHCGKDKFKSFNCTDGSECVKTMQRTYEVLMDEGRNIQWLINSWPIKYVINSTAKDAFCPFNLTTKHSIMSNKDDCYTSELELLAGFLFSESNWTAISSQRDLVDYPVVQMGNSEVSPEKTGPTISLTPARGSELAFHNEDSTNVNATVDGNKVASRSPRLTPSRNSSSLSISVGQKGNNTIRKGPTISLAKGSGYGGVSIVVDGGSKSSNGSGIIVSGMNGVTLSRNEVEKLPSISYQTLFRTLGKVQVVWTGSSGGFKFITSDGVTSLRDNSLNSFTQPLDRKVWILILISTLGVIFLFPDSKGKYDSFLKNAVNMAGMLVEQSTVNQSPKAHLWSKLRTLFLLTWVLPVMVIINSYRSLFQSNYIVEPSYFTTWDRLSEIKHFRLFFVFELTEHSLCSNEAKLASIWKSRCCTDSFGVNWRETDRGFCFAAQLMWNFSHTHTANAYLTDADFENLGKCHKTLRYLLKENLRVLCTKEITETIRNELTKPQTAFVTDKSHLAAEWLHFEEYMKSSRIKFTAPPEGLNVPQGYTYPTGLSRYHLKLVPAKLKTLMHSGMYSLWKKWEQMRREFQLRKALRGLTKERKDFEPLSLDGSDIYLVFHALGIGFGLCCMCFTIEIVRYFSQIKIFCYKP